MRLPKLKKFRLNTPRQEPSESNYGTRAYWNKRSDLIYYRYVDLIVRTIGSDAASIIDVGTGNCPYLEWFDWVEKRVSVDIKRPYQSENVQGVEGNILNIDLGQKFDICLCLQVLEHVPNVEAFAARVLGLAKTTIISVPHNWPAGKTKGHVHDPVTLEKLTEWIGIEPNFYLIASEPFRYIKNERLIAIYDRDPKRKFHLKDFPNVRHRPVASSQNQG